MSTRTSRCHNCGHDGNLPERRVLYGNQVWYRYTCDECGESWEQATITIGQPRERELETFR